MWVCVMGLWEGWGFRERVVGGGRGGGLRCEVAGLEVGG